MRPCRTILIEYVVDNVQLTMLWVEGYASRWQTRPSFGKKLTTQSIDYQTNLRIGIISSPELVKEKL